MSFKVKKVRITYSKKAVSFNFVSIVHRQTLFLLPTPTDQLTQRHTRITYTYQHPILSASQKAPSHRMSLRLKRTESEQADRWRGAAPSSPRRDSTAIVHGNDMGQERRQASGNAKHHRYTSEWWGDPGPMTTFLKRPAGDELGPFFPVPDFKTPSCHHFLNPLMD